MRKGEQTVLPQQTLTVRAIGDTGSPYWTAASLDGVKLHLEPGETVLNVGHCRISQHGPKSWTLQNTTLVVTDLRTVFLTTQFEKGGGWVGFGAAGLAIAVTANAVSSRRAAQRSAGKVAIGQVRHEWLTGITLRRKEALLTGIVDIYIDLAVATAAGPRVIELWAPRAQGINEDFARWLVRTIAQHRLALLGPESAAGLATLRRYQQGGHDAAGSAKPDDLGWSFPGKTDELIAAVISAQAPAPGTRTGIVESPAPDSHYSRGIPAGHHAADTVSTQASQHFAGKAPGQYSDTARAERYTTGNSANHPSPGASRHQNPAGAHTPARAFNLDLRRLSQAERTVCGASLVVFISLFLPWFGLSVPGSSFTVSGMNAHGYLVIVAILALLLTAYLLLQAGWDHFQVTLPVTHQQILFLGSSLQFLLVIIGFFDVPYAVLNWGFGAYLGLIASATAVGPLVIPLIRSQQAGR